MILDLTTKVSHEEIEKWLEKKENKLIATGHIGTHLDTYMKSRIPLDYFKRAGLFLDVSNIDNNVEIDIKDIEHINIEKGMFVIIRTGQIERYKYGSKEYFEDHPQLSDNLIEYLIKREVSFIGIDCAGIRRGNEHEKADRLCEANGVYIIENLCNLEKISKSSFMVYTMWLDDDILTGLKCKVIAEF